MKKIKLAVIGIGLAYERLHKPALDKLKDKYEIVALCDNEKDYKEMLKKEDIDAVLICVPIAENHIVAKDVLMAGKNVIAEKPFAKTVEEAEELIKLKDKNNLKVMVAENYRYDECYNLVKKELDKKTIGEVLYFVYETGADFENDMLQDTFASKEWRQHPAFEGGIFLDGGIHDIALMRFLFGDYQELYSIGKPQEKDYCKYSNITAIMKFKDNVVGNYTYYSSGMGKQFPPIGLRIVGTKGDIYLESKSCEKICINFKDDTSKVIKFKKEMGYYNQLLDYYDGNIVSTPEKEIGDIKMIFDILNKIK